METRYVGDQGEAYWRYQRPLGELGGRLNLGKFQPYVTAEDRVIDFGCGGGFLLENLWAKEKIGIEMNPAAREAGISRGLDVRAALNDVADGWADVVVSNHALEHVATPYEVLREMSRVLRPGGRLVMWLPIDDWRSEGKPDPADVNGHLHTWTPQLMYNLLTMVGFQVDTVRVVSHAWPPGARVLGRNSLVFKVAGTIWAVVKKRRQLFVLAAKPRAESADE